MTQENKDLLLKDLCARLPYGVKFTTTDIKGVWTLNCITSFKENGDIIYCPNIVNRIDCVKPYLRPMSSMTDKELVSFLEIRGMNLNSDELKTFRQGETAIVSILPSYSRHIDWLNANHFDYRGLIPKDLAIEVTKENNPYKN